MRLRSNGEAFLALLLGAYGLVGHAEEATKGLLPCFCSFGSSNREKRSQGLALQRKMEDRHNQSCGGRGAFSSFFGLIGYAFAEMG